MPARAAVVRAVTAAAETNRRLPKRTSGTAATAYRVDGDELTEFYVRRAAAAARQLPPSIAAKAFLVGLGVALDGSPMPPKTPGASTLLEQIEPRSARAARLASLGAPTMHGRRDLAQHFAVSAALAVLVGPQAAEQVGVAKEISDSRGGSGFSFSDLLADIAGIEFASAIVTGRLPLSRVESGFFAQDFLPDVIAFQGSHSLEGFFEAVRLAARRTIVAGAGIVASQSPGDARPHGYCETGRIEEATSPALIATKPATHFYEDIADKPLPTHRLRKARRRSDVLSHRTGIPRRRPGEERARCHADRRRRAALER